MAATAKVFMSGRSQAVRLPKEFRFDVDEVQIERTLSRPQSDLRAFLIVWNRFPAIFRLTETKDWLRI
jgi:hypothetical protein